MLKLCIILFQRDTILTDQYGSSVPAGIPTTVCVCVCGGGVDQRDVFNQINEPTESSKQ